MTSRFIPQKFISFPPRIFKRQGAKIMNPAWRPEPAQR
jgi:hypothetical protein